MALNDKRSLRDLQGKPHERGPHESLLNSRPPPQDAFAPVSAPS